MRKSVESYEDDGFKVEPVKKKPVKKPKTVQKAVQKEPQQTIVAVVENQGVLAETQKSNKVMQLAVAEIAKTMNKIGEKPKKLVCKNIERDQRGLMKSFEIEVME